METSRRSIGDQSESRSRTAWQSRTTSRMRVAIRRGDRRAPSKQGREPERHGQSHRGPGVRLNSAFLSPNRCASDSNGGRRGRRKGPGAGAFGE